MKYVPKVRVVADRKETIFSQTIHLCSDSSFKIFIEDWHCIINFMQDEGTPRYVGRLEAGVQHIDFYNHESTSGLSISEPFTVASATGLGAIYMSYYTKLIGEKVRSRRFEFTLWIDAK